MINRTASEKSQELMIFGFMTLTLVPCGWRQVEAQGATRHGSLAPPDQYLIADRNAEVALARLSSGSLTATQAIPIAIRNRGAVQYRTPAQTSAKPVWGQGELGIDPRLAVR